ncbi:MAG: DUF3102 domain-containing protein [Thermodesulfobacteriota bacterium]
MYIYPITKNKKVLDYRTTEPGLQLIFEAKRLRDERQELYKDDFEKREFVENYVDAIREELFIRCKAFKYHIFEIGKLLCELKTILRHGEFQNWIDNNFEFCRKTAHNFMKVYRACMGHPEVVEYFNPSCLYVITSPDFPVDLRQALFEGVNGKVDVKKKELVKIAIQFRNREVKTTDKVVQDLLKKQKDISIREKYIIELKGLNQLISDRLKKIEKLPNINPSNPLIEKYTDEEALIRDEEDYEIIKMLERFTIQINTMIKELDEKCN